MDKNQEDNSSTAQNGEGGGEGGQKSGSNCARNDDEATELLRARERWYHKLSAKATRWDELWQWCREFHAWLGTAQVPMGLERRSKKEQNRRGDARCLDAYRAITDTKESSVNYRKSLVVQRWGREGLSRGVIQRNFQCSRYWMNRFLGKLRCETLAHWRKLRGSFNVIISRKLF